MIQFIPLIRLFILKQIRSGVLQRMVRRTAVPFIRMVYQVRVVHQERLPTSGGALLLPNHVTFADAFFISAASPRPVRFVMEKAYMRRPVVKQFAKFFKTVTLDQTKPREAIRIMIDALKNGEIVCLFPEGQLTRTGTLCEIRRGCEVIAQKAGHPVLPVYVDGTWGSIFSYERNRFFGKLPYRIPYPLYVAFGPALEPKDVSIAEVRSQIYRASADAIASRFPDGEPTVVNGYQVGNVNALPRRASFHVLAGDLSPELLPGLFIGFGTGFRSYPEMHDTFPEDAAGNWVGAEMLRAELAKRQTMGNIVFYDFSKNSPIPLDAENVQHFPCLAVEGQVVSLSMADPAQTRGSDPQTGHKAHTYGKLLPGWYVAESLVSEGESLPQLTLQGPVSGQRVKLPPGVGIDAEGFVG